MSKNDESNNILKGIVFGQDKVVSTFSKLGKKSQNDMNKTIGCLNSVTNADKLNVSDAHAQGSNVYVDCNGRKYFIVSYDNRGSSMKGRLVIFPEPMCEQVSAINIEISSEHTSGGKNYVYNHPGSFQIIDDYLFLPIEYYKDDGKQDQNSGFEIQVFNLSELASYEEDENFSLKPFARYSEVPSTKSEVIHRAGMLGVSKNWIGIQDNNNFYLYRIDRFNGSDFLLSFAGCQELQQAEGIALIEELNADPKEENALYLVSLSCDEIEDSWTDIIRLYKVTANNGISVTSVTNYDCYEKKYDGIHVYTDPGNGGTDCHGVHFKFGGGVYLLEHDKDDKHDEDYKSITCFATGQKIQKGKRFHFNTFSTEDRIEVTCKSSPLSGQGARASQNFSVKGFSQKSVKFSLYVNGKNCTDEVEVNVSRDVDNGKDHSVYGNVGVVDGKKWQDTIEKYSGESPLYFSNPVVPSSYGDNTTLKFIIEGTDEAPTEK